MLKNNVAVKPRLKSPRNYQGTLFASNYKDIEFKLFFFREIAKYIIEKFIKLRDFLSLKMENCAKTEIKFTDFLKFYSR